MKILVDETLLKKAVKRLKEYKKVVDMENGDAVETLVDLLPDTESLIEELEDDVATQTEETTGFKVYEGQKPEIVKLIEDYAKKHNLAVSLGGEYIYQDDKAQEDAIELVNDIFKIFMNEQGASHEED